MRRKGEVWYKMVGCDNLTSAGYKYVGKTLPLAFSDMQFFFGPLYSSTIQSKLKSGKRLTIVTMNTTYIFEEQK